jgi:hypothetical protein
MVPGNGEQALNWSDMDRKTRKAERRYWPPDLAHLLALNIFQNQPVKPEKRPNIALKNTRAK